MAFSRTSVGILGGFGGIPFFFLWDLGDLEKKTILLLESLPSKKMDYMSNSQKYFYVTYVMHYMIITYFYSLSIFLCKGGLY